jgi:hypothetical protein
MKIIIAVVLLLVLTACETGTKYDRNETLKINDELPSGLVDRTKKIEYLANEDDRELAQFDEEIHNRVLEEDKVVLTKTTFSGGKVQDGLEVKEIRQGRHEGYIRLVFDVHSEGQSADSVGPYNVKYHIEKNTIEVVLNGYRKFSAPLPRFSSSSIVKELYFGTYLDDSGFKFNINLRHKSKIRVFDLKQPARLVIDIKPI